MAINESTAREPRSGADNSVWAWEPPVPLVEVPVLVWPPRILEAIRYLISRGFLLSFLLPFGALSTFTWYYLQPALERCVELQVGWIAQLFVRNFVLIAIIAGGLHLYFHTFNRAYRV